MTGAAGWPAFRLGGDEFALILPGLSARCAHAAMEDVRRDIARRLGGVTASIGLSTLESGGDSALLLEQADVALYEAKRLGRDRTVHDAHVRGPAPIATPAQIAATRKLIAKGDVRVLFQPIIDLDRDRVLGYEALMRPPGGCDLAGPLEAFDVAEKIGHAVELDELCRAAALADSVALPAESLLFVNLHPRELERDPALAAGLLHDVRAAGRRPEQVVLELTERADARLDVLVPAVRELRAHGFLLAVDDVGEGNAGLEMLRRLPVDFVKISRDVVTGALTDRGARGVLHALLAFAAESGVYVIAEGIETRTMLELVQHPQRHGILAPRGVRGAQGFLLGTPQRLGVPPPPAPAPRPADRAAVALRG